MLVLFVYMQPAIERKKPQTTKTKTKHTFLYFEYRNIKFMYHLIENIWSHDLKLKMKICFPIHERERTRAL